MIFLFEYQSIRDFHPTMLDSRRLDVVFCHFAVSRQVTLNHPYKAPVPALLAKHSWKSRVRRLPSRVWLRSSPSPHKRIETLSNVSKKATSNQQKKIEKLLLKDVSNLSAAIAVPSALLSLRGSLGTPQKPQKPMGVTPKRQSLR